MKKLLAAVTVLAVSTAQADTIFVDAANCPGGDEHSLTRCRLDRSVVIGEVEHAHMVRLVSRDGEEGTRSRDVLGGSSPRTTASPQFIQPSAQ